MELSKCFGGLEVGMISTINSGSRWTIDGPDVTVYHPKGRRVSLKTEETDKGTRSLVTAIPCVDDLNDCWSNSPSNLYSVEAAELMEKCLLWNRGAYARL